MGCLVISKPFKDEGFISNWDFQLWIFCRPSIDPRLSQAPSGGPTNLTVVTVGNGVNFIHSSLKDQWFFLGGGFNYFYLFFIFTGTTIFFQTGWHHQPVSVWRFVLSAGEFLSPFLFMDPSTGRMDFLASGLLGTLATWKLWQFGGKGWFVRTKLVYLRCSPWFFWQNCHITPPIVVRVKTPFNYHPQKPPTTNRYTTNYQLYQPKTHETWRFYALSKNEG